jgi:hypothetical protein
MRLQGGAAPLREIINRCCSFRRDVGDKFDLTGNKGFYRVSGTAGRAEDRIPSRLDASLAVDAAHNG